MNIELRNVKIVASMSEETTCFTASIYIDGRAVGTASNQGFGGQTDVRLPADLYARVKAFALAQPDHSEYEPVEGYIDRLLMQHNLRKEARRLVNSRLVYLQDGQLYQSKCAKPDVLAKWKPQAIAKGRVVLDEEQVYQHLLKEATAPFV